MRRIVLARVLAGLYPCVGVDYTVTVRARGGQFLQMDVVGVAPAP